MQTALTQRAIVKNRSFFIQLLYNFFLVISGSLLFYLSFPNNFIRFGWGFLVFFCLIPIYILVHRNSLRSMPFWGFIYGFTTYIMFNSWLFIFDPNASWLVPSIYGTYFMAHFMVMKIFMLRFPRYSFIFLAISWVAYEYLRTKGFLGYSFGVLGYALSFYPYFIQITDIFGVWIICLLVVIPSCLVYKAMVDNSLLWKQFLHNKVLLISSCVYGVFFILVLAYGVASKIDYGDAPTKKIGLVQHVMDPWKGGERNYRKSLEVLTELSDTLLEKEDDIHMIVWSETAFVPSIAYHLRYKENTHYVQLINELMHYFKKYPNTYFLIGNGEGIRSFDENNQAIREDYNASLLFYGAQRLGAYYKLHLVPFTEHFPYKRSLSFFYNMLKERDVHFWKKGEEYTIHNTKELRFATPICFEDGFGAQNAEFVRRGAEILINITNDAWSGMEVNAMQHLQLSILRAVENRRSVIRATNAGMTAIIDPNGEIQSMLPSFKRDSIVYEVPIYKEKTTLYTQYKDWFAILCLIIVIISFLCVILKIGDKR